MIIYSSDPSFKSIELDVECDLGEYVNIEDEKLPRWAYYYAKNIRCRWSDIGHTEMEDIIGKDPRSACYYAVFVLRKRWSDIGKPEVEDVIGKHPQWAYQYADYILHCRWADIGKPEVEDTINKNPEWAYFYTNLFLDRICF